ncbi:MAG TPA: SET domain-containing protein-lysine N-methyltransferase [Gemmatimonadaceae bacterium]|nr:SET domain-containing protein-lysine N-methyltransferase [Gemmatimonadaceae bacterium]
MPTSQLPLFEIRESPIAGKGAFALQPIPAWTRLIEYTGERVSHEVADARYEEEESAGNTHTVLFSVDDKTVIDAGVNGNDARFFNHSCGPNCQSRIIRKRVYLETIRAIKPGEELTYDYEIPNEGETEETARRKWPCQCGAPNCRGTLLLPPAPKRKARRKTTRKMRRRSETRGARTKKKRTASRASRATATKRSAKRRK